ncbi:MAG TPA: response regulator [Polyangiaceae bacterium]
MTDRAASSERAVVIADDDPASRELLKDWLEGLSCSVHEAKDGLELMNRVASLTSGPHRGAPFLVVSDVNMPECDGLTALHTIRSQYPAARVVLVTSFPSEALIARARALGAEVLEKPLRIQELHAIAQAQFGVERQADSEET